MTQRALIPKSLAVQFSGNSFFTLTKSLLKQTMLSLLHHCQITEAIPDLHTILSDFIMHVKINFFWKFRPCVH